MSNTVISNDDVEKQDAQKAADEQFYQDTVSSLINPDLVEVNLVRRQMDLSVNMPETVDRAKVEALLRDGADVAFSRSFAGYVNGVFTRYGSVHEAQLDLSSNVDSFAETLFGKVVPQDGESMNFEDFIMSIEVFDTRNDPNWAFPLVSINVVASNLNVARLLSNLK